MMQGDRLRVGVVGLGGAGRRLHIPCLARIKKAQLVAVCDLDDSLASQVARAYRLPRHYTSLSMMLANEHLDYIHLCTPPQHHFAGAALAIKAGCSVLMEKPFTLNLQEAEELIRQARASDLQISVIHNLLSCPTALKTKKQVDEGHIGRLTSVHALWGSPPSRHVPWTDGLPGGHLAEVLPHVLYLTLTFIGHVQGLDVRWAPARNSADNAVGVVVATIMGSMAIATLSYNLDSPQPAHITLCGTKQSLRATFAPGHSLERLPVGLDDPRSVLFDVGLELGSGFAGVARRWDFLTSVAVKGWRSGHYRQIRAFVNSMLGFGEPTVSVREILQFMQVYSEILRRLPVAAKQVVSPQPEALDTPVRRSPDQK